jgi:hypothetical protein
MTEARSLLQEIDEAILQGSPEGRAALGRSALHRVQPDAEGLGPRPALVPKLLALSAIACAIALAGCASNSAQRESRAMSPIQTDAPPHQRESKAVPPIHAAAPPHRYSERRIHRPDRALLAPQPAPNCAFGGFDDLKPVDPDQWARMKLDYERHCYQHAEQLVRDRLRLLQAASK